MTTPVCKKLIEVSIARRCTEPESGGRIIDNILTNTMLPDISGAFLTRMLDGSTPGRVDVGADGAGFAYSFDCVATPAPPATPPAAPGSASLP